MILKSVQATLTQGVDKVEAEGGRAAVDAVEVVVEGEMAAGALSLCSTGSRTICSPTPLFPSLNSPEQLVAMEAEVLLSKLLILLAELLAMLLRLAGCL